MLLTAHLVSATKVYYVLPDNISPVHCPSQPCATLSQYLQDNSTLSFVSDVEYHFLPGEHRVTTNMMIQHVENVLLSGSTLLNRYATLRCHSGVFISIRSSNNITITSVSIRHCGNNLASLLMHSCENCTITNVNFYPPTKCYSIAGINLLGESYLVNIAVNLNASSSDACGKGIFLMHNGSISTNRIINSTTIISNFSVDGTDFLNCLSNDDSTNTILEGIILTILLQQTEYTVTIKICHSLINKLYYSGEPIVFAVLMNCNVTFENCTFAQMKYIPTTKNNKTYPIPPMISMSMPNLNVLIRFAYCTFRLNVLSRILALIDVDLYHVPNDCEFPFSSTVVIESCAFTQNCGGALKIHSDWAHYNTTKILLLGDISISYTTKTVYLVFFKNVAVYLNGTIDVFENSAEIVFLFLSCTIVVNGNFKAASNGCKHLVFLKSNTKYIKVEEYSNITFLDHQHCFLITLDEHSDGIFCPFQYISSNSTYNNPPSTDHYAITFTGNFMTKSYESYTTIYYLSIHCKWLPEAAYYGYHSRSINEKIIDIPRHKNYERPTTRICLCSSNGGYDCSIDEVGPIYPGQMLQINISIPNKKEMSVVYTEIHDILLPKSACTVTHQTDDELINKLNGDCSILDFVIVSNSTKGCELFFTVEPDGSTYIPNLSDSFYVQLSQCPVGFSLLDGICDCDLILSNSDLHIETCYIEQAAIIRPANSWISSDISLNGAKYLLSTTCPMDYCLPYSSALNLSNPDLQCQFNRSGILCSQCQHALSMVFGSSRCMKCNNVHILITLIVIVAGIVLVVLLYLLNLTVTNGTINGIIFYANIVSINNSVFLVNDNVFKPLKVFISFINLDLGIETCYYNGMDSYAKMWLQLFFPLYLILIATFIIIASRYSYRIQRLTYTRSLPVLATLFLLSYTGILRAVSTVLFSYSTITELPSGHQQLVWSIDASVPLFGVKFTILFITCLVLFLILIPFNFILMFTRFLQFKIVHHVRPLLVTVKESYKSECYYWFALNIVIRNIFLTLYTVRANIQLMICTFVLVCLCAASAYLQPYKDKIANIQELFLLLNLTVLYSTTYRSFGNELLSLISNVMITATLLHFSMILLYHFLTYICHYNIMRTLVDVKEMLKNFFSNESATCHSNDMWLLNIPEDAYNNDYHEVLDNSTSYLNN